jgi:hypothetical protein
MVRIIQIEKKVLTSQFSVTYPAHSPHEGQQQQQKQNTASYNQRNFPTMQFSWNLRNIQKTMVVSQAINYSHTENEVSNRILGFNRKK